jgi:hypothetical protein
MIESAVQMPTLIHTATGGKKIARIPRKMSEPHMVAFEEGMGYLTKRTV